MFAQAEQVLALETEDLAGFCSLTWLES